VQKHIEGDQVAGMNMYRVPVVLLYLILC